MSNTARWACSRALVTAAKSARCWTGTRLISCNTPTRLRPSAENNWANSLTAGRSEPSHQRRHAPQQADWPP